MYNSIMIVFEQFNGRKCLISSSATNDGGGEVEKNIL